MGIEAKTIAFLTEVDFEDLELFYPLIRLREARVRTIVVGTGDKQYRGKHGLVVPVDANIGDVKASDLDGIVVPGGWCPDRLRRDQTVLNLVREVSDRGGLIASICHGPWVLISAGILKGRRLTGVIAVKDDIVNAGGTFIDQEVVVDGNLVTARTPRDIPAWGRAIIAALG